MEAVVSSSVHANSRKSGRAKQNRELVALRQLSQALSGLKEVDAVLQVALEQVLDIVHGFVGGILLLDRETETLSYKVHRGLSEEYTRAAAHYRLGQGIIGLVAQTGKPLLLEDVSNDPRVAYPDFVAREGLRAFISVPLRVKGEVQGVLHIASHEPQQYTVTDMHLLNLIGDQIGLAIEQASLYERLKRGGERYRMLARQILVAQEDEQRRIARELHDETGQTLAGLALQLQVLIQMAEKDKADPQLVDKIKMVQQLAIQMHSELRRVISHLHPAVLDQMGLIQAVQLLVDTTLKPIGIQATLEVKGDERSLPLQVEASIFRVIQGIVGNVAQHSKAKKAHILVEYGKAQLHLSISDNGVGFDISQVAGIDGQGRGMGLLSMKERVGVMGGTCFIQSAIGRGTTALASFPIGRRDDNAENKSSDR